MIEIKNLVKNFDDKRVFDNVDLTINENSIYGVVGINGAGKSTLIRHMAGVYKQDSGSIIIDGEPVYENKKVKSDIFLFSDEIYFPYGNTLNQVVSY